VTNNSQISNGRNFITADSTVTLLNKTINCANVGTNLQNVSNDEIASDAGISATKIANGGVTNAEFQQLATNAFTEGSLNIFQQGSLSNGINVGTWHQNATYAQICHYALRNTNDAYAVIQAADGESHFNAPVNKAVNLKNDNDTRLRVERERILFYKNIQLSSGGAFSSTSSLETNHFINANTNGLSRSFSYIYLRNDNGNHYGSEIGGGLRHGSDTSSPLGTNDSNIRFVINIRNNGGRIRVLNINRFSTVSLGNGSTVSSDNRLKHNEIDLPDNCLDIINKLKPKKYIKTNLQDDSGNYYGENHNFDDWQWSDDSTDPTDKGFIESGLIAQEVLQVPELKSFVKESVETDDNGVKQPYTLDYNSINMYLLKAVQELSSQVNILNTELTAVKNQLENNNT